jgi:magnesium transporter
MRKSHHKRSKKAGLRPGSLVHIGETYTDKSKISLINYDESTFSEKEINSSSDLRTEKDKQGIIWINIDGLQDTKLVEDIGSIFGLHPLVMEDILNTDQRPKMEDYCDYIYIVLRNFTD